MLGFMGTRLAGFLFTNFNVMLKYMQSDKADRVQRKWTCRSWPIGKSGYRSLITKDVGYCREKRWATVETGRSWLETEVPP